jgi:hypothetical protein
VGPHAQQVAPSRRDDLESLAYLLIQCLKGARPLHDLLDANRTSRDSFGLEMSSRRRSQHPPNPSNTSVACIEGYTFTTNVWALCLVQGPFSVAPVPNPTRPIRIQIVTVDDDDDDDDCL